MLRQKSGYLLSNCFVFLWNSQRPYFLPCYSNGGNKYLVLGNVFVGTLVLWVRRSGMCCVLLRFFGFFLRGGFWKIHLARLRWRLSVYVFVCACHRCVRLSLLLCLCVRECVRVCLCLCVCVPFFRSCMRAFLCLSVRLWGHLGFVDSVNERRGRLTWSENGLLECCVVRKGRLPVDFE